MCLKTVIKTFKPNDNMRVGYKVFRKDTNLTGVSYHNLYFKLYTDYFMGRAYEAKALFHPYGHSSEGTEYETYFHIFDTLEGAERYVESGFYSTRLPLVICEVIAWDIRAIGTQTESENVCFISKCYRIMEEIEHIQPNPHVI